MDQSELARLRISKALSAPRCSKSVTARLGQAAWAFASPMRKNGTRLQHDLKIGVRLCESRKIRAGSVFRPRGNYCRYIEIASTPPFS